MEEDVEETAKGPGTNEEVYKSTMADSPFRKVSIDTVGPLPVDADGNKYIIVAIDCFTRVVELKATKSTTAVEAASFMLEIFGRYGPPEVIHSDNGPQYAAEIVKEFVALLGTKKSSTLPYRPQANGICERANKEVMRHLEAITLEDPEVRVMWSRALPLVSRIVNYSYHSAIGTYPAKLLYGMNTNGEGILLKGVNTEQPSTRVNSRGDVVDCDPQTWLTILTDTQKVVIKASRAHQQKVIDARVTKKPKTHELFEVGDFVLSTYPNDRSGKLQCKWRGPFLVVEKVKTNEYRIQHLHERSRVEIVHVTRLKRYLNVNDDAEDAALMDKGENKIEFIVDHNPPGPFQRGKKIMDFKVRWLGYTEDHDLWIPYTEKRIQKPWTCI
jgi:hypothetical protein